MTYKKISQLKTSEAFKQYLGHLGVELGFDDEVQSGVDSPLAQIYELPEYRIGNRFCVHPMEGWDGTLDGFPSDLTQRRWRRFGQSGAKLIWGGEAAAVLPEARANPNQLIIDERTLPAIEALRQTLVDAHAQRWSTNDLYIGLQLTHSGRFCKPNSKTKMEPITLYRHPILDKKFGLAEDHPLLTDMQIEGIIEAMIKGAVLAQKAGFHFVDVKHCHGYLGHEFLSAVDRPGNYGGSFENRTRFLREVVSGIRSEAPGMQIGVRLSAFDFMPFQLGEDGIGQSVDWQGAYPYAFGGDDSGKGVDLTEAHQFLDLLEKLGIHMVNITAGSPYYVPHIQRPAWYPPSDGYQLVEDPLVGVARLLNAAAELKTRHPNLMLVGTGFTYLQEWLPNVAQNMLRKGKLDFVGLGRMVLSYPELPVDILEGKPLQRKRICRTFSDCTNAPRRGFISGCFPLDEFYKQRPEKLELMEAKSK